MAAFSFQHYPFPLDSVFPPLKNLPSFAEEPNFYPPEFLPLPEIQPNLAASDNEPSSLTKKPSSDSSSLMNSKLENGEQVTQQVNHSIGHRNSKRKKKNSVNGSSSSSPIKDEREGRGKKQRKGSEMKEEEEGKKPKAKKKGGEEEPPSGYIHVRARRGQATDSHSLAERVRREKISERMKILQRLVPGCDKVTGKALMLDEIINYVQSLQNQVEFLSMKLASVNPLFYEFAMDLDALTLRPDRGLNSYTPALSPMQQSNPVPPLVFADATTTTTATTATDSIAAAFATSNNYHPVIDAPTSLLLQGQRPNDYIQGSGSLMWDMEEQRQKFLNQSGLINNGLCSFH